MSFQEQFQINGLVDTSKPVLENMKTISRSAGAWVTWDPSLGKWAVIQNKPETSSRSFDYSNIIGELTVTGRNLNDIANSIVVTYRDSDRNNSKEIVELSIADEDYYDNELPNQLSMELGLVNNTIQAQLIGAYELKQNRLDAVIDFRTDYSEVGVKAGDVIDVTSEAHNYTAKLFRVISVEEADEDDGQLVLSITAIEYDEDVYDATGLEREERNQETGIPPRNENRQLQAADAAGVVQGGREGITQQFEYGGFQSGIPLFGTLSFGVTNSQASTVFGAGTGTDKSGDGRQGYLQWDVNATVKTMNISFDGPQGEVNYTVDTKSDTIYAGVPVFLTLKRSTTGAWAGEEITIATKYMEWSTYSVTFNVGRTPASQWRLYYRPLVTYDLNATDIEVEIDSVTSFFTTITIDGTSYAAGINIQAFLE